MDLQPGTILHNRYEIQRTLGVGGMGAVYLARDTSLDHEVALKVNRSTSPHASAQFLREARLLASLRHSHLPRVTDYFVEGPEQYLVMDYIPGEDLGVVLKNAGRLPYERVLKWAAQLGSALNYLHTQTPPIIHRDIKPANIKLMLDDSVVLVDFGIAKAAEVGVATTTGAMGYTPGYAPPEQYGSAHTGPYSDQYSMAATIYNLLTGQKPADAVQRMLGQAGLAPVRSLAPEVPEYIEKVLERGLAVQPEARFSSVSEFVGYLTNPQQVLAPVSQTPTNPGQGYAAPATQGWAPQAQPSGGATVAGPYSGSGAQPPAYNGYPVVAKKRGIPGWLLGLIIAVVVMGGGLGVYLATRGPAAPPPAITPSTSTLDANIAVSTATQTPMQEITNTPEPTITATLEPTSLPTIGQIALVSDRGGDGNQIWLLDVGVDDTGAYLPLNEKQITKGGNPKYQPAWSPDGSKLLLVSQGADAKNKMDIYLVDLKDLATGPVDLTNKAGNEFSPRWSPDGQWIVFVIDSREDGIKQLARMRPDGSEMSRISVYQEEFGPSFSPDGQLLMMVQYARSFDNINIYDLRIEGTPTPMPYDRKQIPGRPGTSLDNPSWSPDGSLVAFVRLDAPAGNHADEGPFGRICVAPYPLKGDDNINVLTKTGKDRDPAWSMDSQYLAFTSNRDSNKEIYIMLSNGTRQLNFTNNPGVDMQPAWKPANP